VKTFLFDLLTNIAPTKYKLETKKVLLFFYIYCYYTNEKYYKYIIFYVYEVGGNSFGSRILFLSLYNLTFALIPSDVRDAKSNTPDTGFTATLHAKKLTLNKEIKAKSKNRNNSENK
jgi:hypothetical protein